jgi:SAM-dependent methyltransferase
MDLQCTVKAMKALVRALMIKESFFPGLLGIFLNPFYFARRGLADAMIIYSKSLSGVLLDVGCGTKPYQSLFDIDEYIGLDIDSEYTRKRGFADFFYDGNMFPFPDHEFNAVLCNQVLEHVFNPDQFLTEINRVMKPCAKMLLTVPFMWDEHEQPYDYARYSSFGLKALLERNGFKLLKHEKLGTDISTIFQLINAYLYKISAHWNKYFRLGFTFTVIGTLNLLGLIARFVLPKNPDLFLDHIVLVEKES